MLVTSGAISGTSRREQVTVIPSDTNPAACFRLASVMRFSVPNSSSSPQRPQLLSESNQPNTSCSVGIVGVVIVVSSVLAVLAQLIRSRRRHSSATLCRIPAQDTIWHQASRRRRDRRHSNTAAIPATPSVSAVMGAPISRAIQPLRALAGK